MVTTKINNEEYLEYRTTITESELKKALSSPRNYYNFMKKLHRQLGIPFCDEMELLEWVIESEKEVKQ